MKELEGCVTCEKLERFESLILVLKIEQGGVIKKKK